jgi:site-specific DNA-methyltransferase (adenine-specific)
MQGMAAHSVDVVVTSPPYNLGIKYSQHMDEMDVDDYLTWAGEWKRAIWQVLAAHGSFFLNVGASPKSPLLPFQLVIEMATGFKLQNVFHWIKSISVDTRSGETISVGHFKPINSPRFVTDCHEFVFHFTKNGDVKLDRLAIGVEYADKSNIARRGHKQDKRCRGNNWFIPYETIQSRDKERPHPATFPSLLPEMCINLHGNTSELTVLDPFVGIGNSAKAAIRCGVKRFVGIDVDGSYLETARQSIQPK